MGKRCREIFFSTAGVVLVVLSSSPACAGIFGDDWEKFFKEKVSFGGFVENTSGVSVSHGSQFFNTSNRFIMNRFTYSAGIQFRFCRAVEIFYFLEIRRRAPVQRRDQKPRGERHYHSAPVRPLPVDLYPNTMAFPGRPSQTFFLRTDLKLRIGRQFISWGETDGHQVTRCDQPSGPQAFPPPAAPNLFNLDDDTRIPSVGIENVVHDSTRQQHDF